MISLVICSKIGCLSFELRKNIEESIDVEYEIVLIDNSKGVYSIFSAYEEGVKRSSFPIICFMHEDILYKAKGWGKSVLKCFEDKSIGLCGVIGSSLMLDIDSCWWSTDCAVGRIWQRRETESYATAFKESELESLGKIDVVTVDGVWFCVRKSLFSDIGFDEGFYGKWHGYDLDVCMQVLQAGYRCVVLSDVKIEHFSTGVLGKEWLSALAFFQKKWKSYLPISRGVELAEDDIVMRKVRMITSNSKIQELNGYLDYYKGNFFTKILRRFRLIK